MFFLPSRAKGLVQVRSQTSGVNQLFNAASGTKESWGGIIIPLFIEIQI